MDNPYLEVISHVERLHRQFLEVVKLELERFGIHACKIAFNSESEELLKICRHHVSSREQVIPIFQESFENLS